MIVVIILNYFLAYQQEVVDSIPKVYAHVKFKMANGCQSGDITFDHSIYYCHYVDEDSTKIGQDTTIYDSLSNQHECPYQCNPYACNPHCCDIGDTDEYGNCIDTCWDSCYQTCYETCYDTTKVMHIINKYSYSNYTDKQYSDVMYSNSIPLLTCPPVISASLDSINAGTNAVSDPPNSSILTINGANFGNEKGVIQIPDANSGGSNLLTLDDTDILSWTNSKIIVKMPSVVMSEDSMTPGSGDIVIRSNCFAEAAEKYLTINYNVKGEAVSDEKLRYNMAMSNDANSLVFRCDTSISNHPLIYAVVQQAIATWNCYTGVNWKLGSDTILASNAQDGVSTIYFTNSLPSGDIMGTYVHVDNSCNNISDSMAYVHEADIAISYIPAVGYTWNYNISDTAFIGNHYYFYDNIMHELGHAHLLNHVDDNTSVMFYQVSLTTRRNLLTGDCPGPQTLYGGFDVVNTSAANTPSCSYGILMPSPRTCVDHTMDVASVSPNQYNLTLYPNPVSNTNVTISYELTQNSYIQFKIIDYTGREIMIMNNEQKMAGSYKEQINTRGFASGIYLFVANINGTILTIKFIKL